jgi:hypothetical protein
MIDSHLSHHDNHDGVFVISRPISYQSIEIIFIPWNEEINPKFRTFGIGRAAFGQLCDQKTANTTVFRPISRSKTVNITSTNAYVSEPLNHRFSSARSLDFEELAMFCFVAGVE